jgi:hypothetical protein
MVGMARLRRPRPRSSGRNREPIARFKPHVAPPTAARTPQRGVPTNPKLGHCPHARFKFFNTRTVECDLFNV